MTSITTLKNDIAACTRCADKLPLGPRPVVQFSQQSRILIAGQAPGIKVHQSGIPFNDASGDRLRQWLGISTETFYDADKIAIVPMGFCYPGRGKSGDLPPRPECAPKWRQPLLEQLSNIELTLVIGKYALDYHLPRGGKTLTEVVSKWQQYWPNTLPLPHPSPRNNLWLKRNPWFEQEVIPALRERIADILSVC